MATIGEKLPALDKEISQRQIDAYSGVRPLSIHTDEAWARAKGFRTCLAQGMMSTAYVSEMMTRLLGAGFVKGGTMSMAFVQPVFAGDRLSGIETRREPTAGRHGSEGFEKGDGSKKHSRERNSATAPHSGSPLS